MFRIKSARGSLFQTFAKISRPVSLKGRIPSAGQPIRPELRRCKSTTTVPPKKSSKSAWIIGGVSVTFGGVLAAGVYLYHNETEFRRFVHEKLPVIEPLLSTVDSYLYTQTPANLQGDRNLPPASGPLNLGLSTPKSAEKHADFPLRKPVKPIAGNQEPVASVSSLDQTAISAVDLAIANSVEKEARQGLNQTETKPEASQEVAPIKQPKAEGGKVESPTAAVSALDHMGISSVDLDIATTVEKEVESVKSAKVSEKTVETSEKGKDVEPPEIKEVDTTLTENEVEAMIDQTAMELMVHQAIGTLKVIGQDAIEAQQKAAGAIKAHVEQLKAALTQSQQEGSLKDLSDVVLNSQKIATDLVAAARAAQVKVNEEVEKLHSIIKEAEAAGAKESGTSATAEAARVSYDVQKAALDMQQSEAEAAVLEGHQKDLQDSKEMFKKELQDIMPGVLTGQTDEHAEEKNIR